MWSCAAAQRRSISLLEYAIALQTSHTRALLLLLLLLPANTGVNADKRQIGSFDACPTTTNPCLRLEIPTAPLLDDLGPDSFNGLNVLSYSTLQLRSTSAFAPPLSFTF